MQVVIDNFLFGPTVAQKLTYQMIEGLKRRKNKKIRKTHNCHQSSKQIPKILLKDSSKIPHEKYASLFGSNEWYLIVHNFQTFQTEGLTRVSEDW